MQTIDARKQENAGNITGVTANPGDWLVLFGEFKCLVFTWLTKLTSAVTTRHPKRLIRGRLKTPADHSTGGLLSTRITPHQIQQMLLHAATLQYMSCKCHEITK